MNCREFALAGGLISYGTSLVGEDRLATDKPETPDGKKVAPGPAGTGVYLEANDGCPLHNDEPTHKQNIPAYTDALAVIFSVVAVWAVFTVAAIWMTS
jgi:hypothetical protein